MLTCQRALRAYRLTSQRALRAYMLTYQRASRAYVITCQSALRAYVVTCQRAYVPTFLACLRAYCLRALRPYVFTCQRVFRAYVFMCQRVSFGATIFSFTAVSAEVVHTVSKVQLFNYSRIQLVKSSIIVFPQYREFIYKPSLLIICRLDKREYR